MTLRVSIFIAREWGIQAREHLTYILQHGDAPSESSLVRMSFGNDPNCVFHKRGNVYCDVDFTDLVLLKY